MNGSTRVPKGFRKGSTRDERRVPKPLIREKAHTCTYTYTCNSTISTPVTATALSPSPSGAQRHEESKTKSSSSRHSNGAPRKAIWIGLVQA